MSNGDFFLSCQDISCFPVKRVSMVWWLLRLSAKILSFLRLSVNFFQLRLTKKLKINFFCLIRPKRAKILLLKVALKFYRQLTVWWGLS